MAFSKRARAYTLTPTLPCPTLPLSPRALSDSSIIPAAGRLCLKLSTFRARAPSRNLTSRKLTRPEPQNAKRTNDKTNQNHKHDAQSAQRCVGQKRFSIRFRCYLTFSDSVRFHKRSLAGWVNNCHTGGVSYDS